MRNWWLLLRFTSPQPRNEIPVTQREQAWISPLREPATSYGFAFL